MAIQTPPQVPPVTRPELVKPHECVDVVYGNIRDMLITRLELMHGANYNDPAAWTPLSWETRGRLR